MSASRSAPILHRISSLDGVQATGEYTLFPCTVRTPLHPAQKKHNLGNYTTRRTVSVSLRGLRGRTKKCGNKSVFFFKANSALSFWQDLGNTNTAVMDIMIAVQDACVSGQWLTAIILSLCCFLPSCLPAGQTVDYSSVESVVSRQGDTALLR